MEKGRSDYDSGWKVILEQGAHQERLSTLLTILELKFKQKVLPLFAKEKLEHASSEQLKIYIEKALKAQVIDEIWDELAVI